jgi:hypothetical protein
VWACANDQADFQSNRRSGDGRDAFSIPDS